MRPVNKGSWPIDPETDAPKVFKDDRKKKDDTYKKAKPDLIDGLGLYCSYCETWLSAPRYFHVEHKLPKGLEKYYSLRGDWDNFLLACAPCNNAKSDKDDDVYWPDIDNTAYIFEYREDGRVFVNPNLSKTEQKKAQRTLVLTGLDRYPGGKNKPTDGDQRYQHRRKAWKKVKSCLEDLEKSIKTLHNLENSDSSGLSPDIQTVLEQLRKDALTIRQKIVDVAIGTGKEDKATGYWSIWMTVFREHPDMLKRFIDAFSGTARECFDDRGRPLPTISRSKPSIDVKSHPSYDSDIWDDEDESLLEEEEEILAEPEDEAPPTDSELSPVDDSSVSEAESRSLFTRFVDAFSEIRQDDMDDRDESPSLEDSETESEDSLEPAESVSLDEPETKTEAIDSEPESEDSLQSAESVSLDEPETETEAIDSEPSAETEAINSDSEQTEQPEATVNRQPQPTQTYSIPQQSPQYLEPINNPSLTQTPRYQIADVIPLEYETSILDWLERSGRLIDRTSTEEDPVDPEEKIAELIENVKTYDDEDEDDMMDDD